MYCQDDLHSSDNATPYFPRLCSGAHAGALPEYQPAASTVPSVCRCVDIPYRNQESSCLKRCYQQATLMVPVPYVAPYNRTNSPTTRCNIILCACACILGPPARAAAVAPVQMGRLRLRLGVVMNCALHCLKSSPRGFSSFWQKLPESTCAKYLRAPARTAFLPHAHTHCGAAPGLRDIQHGVPRLRC